MHPLIRKINEKKKKRNININFAVLPSHNMNARRERNGTGQRGKGVAKWYMVRGTKKHSKRKREKEGH